MRSLAYLMMRLTGGEFKGREIKTLPGEKTRPTGAKLRQALFNSIQFEIEGSSILDLFAGSGALGFEAVSRGAESCVFVESAPSALRMIRENAGKLDCTDRVRFVSDSYDRCDPAVSPNAPFDFVFCDPPYAAGYELKILTDLPWENWLKPGGALILEWGRTKSQFSELPDQIGVLIKSREKTYGDSFLTTYRRTRDEDAAESETETATETESAPEESES